MERLRIYTALKLLPLPQYLVFLFQYPLNLHCSQTRMVDDIKDGKFPGHLFESSVNSEGIETKGYRYHVLPCLRAV